MASLKALKILDLTRVAPNPNSPHSAAEFSLPLTFFDAFWIKFPPVERVFFYQLTDSNPHHFISVILPKLKHSLSLTLLHYLPLAGSIIWPDDAPKPSIHYTQNDAVSLIVAESNADFHRLSGDGIRESVELRSLVPELLTCDDKASLISLQITFFPNQGFCLGVTNHHAIMDGMSVLMFMKSWAYICKQAEENPALLPELTPLFDRTVIRDPAGLDMVYLKNWSDFFNSGRTNKHLSLKVMQNLGVNPNSARATFKLTSEDVKILKQRVLSIINKVERDDQMNPKKQQASVMEENGIGIVAEKISDIIKGIDEKELYEGGEKRLTKSWDMEQGAQVIGVAGSIRFEVYGVDFGWGRPKKVEIVSTDRTGAIALAESREGNGVEIGVVLSPHEFDVFASLFVSGLQNL
ncbi:Phenolic glucoside malonyltransferase [Melia azedarach]|uniref:Phenolic glucoside malonyltransferase n=1 Tax=Melia azedarach TaxID=155640 RepID=A0ACC1X9B3_MELAZ|nr:Phenolic glucoside malonyltransferase [Melia azedarach]